MSATHAFSVRFSLALTSNFFYILGHGPYSHLWEFFIKEADPNADYHHEDTSIQMFEHLLEENQLRPVLKELAGIDETDILFIKEQIVGVIDEKTG